MKISPILLRMTAAVVLLGVYFVNPAQVLAFKPASHYVLLEKTKNELPKDSIIRKALDENFKVAALGAIGPDLGYCTLSTAEGYSPWADRFHYQKVGTFAATQMKLALKSGDKVKIAWAAGWITHIAGDLYCHGTFVNPETGVYLANSGTRKRHRQLELWAEPYIWDITGGHDDKDFGQRRFPPNFPNTLPDKVMDLLIETSKEVFDNDAPTKTEIKEWTMTFRGILTDPFLTSKYGPQIYRYFPFEDARVRLNTKQRLVRLNKSFGEAKSFAVSLLTNAEKDYNKDPSKPLTGFSDAWNLDSAPKEDLADNKSIRSITVKIHTTDNQKVGKVVFEVNGGSLAKGLHNEGHKDFRKDQTDYFYLYNEDKVITPAEITKFSLKGENSVAWTTDSILVWIDGSEMLNNHEKRKFDRNNSRADFVLPSANQQQAQK